MSKKLRVAFVAFLTAMLVPSLAAGQEKSLTSIPGGGFISTVFGWIKMVVLPDMNLWWLWVITFPLTIIWMIWATAGTKKAFNNAGGVILFGLLALAILLSVYGPFIGVVMLLFSKVTGLLSLGMNPSLSGTWNMIKGIIYLIPLFLVLWLLTKIPGVQTVVGKVLSVGKDIAGRAWALRNHAKEHPAWYYQAFGAAVIAGVINGSLVTNLTAKVAFPGIIPAASAAVGLFFLFWRTVGGRRLMDNVVHRIHPSLSSVPRCPNANLVFVRDKQERKIPDPKNPGKFKVELHVCGTEFPQGAKDCPNPRCPYPNPDWIHECAGCGFRGKDGKGFRRNKRQEHQKCPECGRNHPPPPERMPFLSLDQEGTTSEPTTPVATPAEPASPPPPVETFPAPPLEKACPSCKELYDASLGYKGCPNCGTPFGATAGTDLAPATAISPKRKGQGRARRLREKVKRPWQHRF
ncbi:MFS transporter [Patescibacteria group bacterium]|nr:MFS transporter [Patescibacteria group bacterium]